MMDILRPTSGVAYEELKDSYEEVLEELAEAKIDWDERKPPRPTNPHKTLVGHLTGWLRQLPFIWFNFGKYDFNSIKHFLFIHFINADTSEEEEDEDVNRPFSSSNERKCLSTNQLKFLDMNYIAPGFSYDKVIWTVWRNSSTLCFH